MVHSSKPAHSLVLVILVLLLGGLTRPVAHAVSLQPVTAAPRAATLTLWPGTSTAPAGLTNSTPGRQVYLPLLSKASATAPALPPVPRGLITHGKRAQMRVALTFDLCATVGNPAEYDTAIIRVLNETRTPATFFASGLWMHYHVGPTLELARNPLFELGNHAWSHQDFSRITAQQMREELLRTQQQMWQLLGRQSTLFRFPYGHYSDLALDTVAAHGLWAIQWDVVSGDPDPRVTAERMIPAVTQDVRPGSIIVMHANGRGWHTAEALPEIIRILRERGYEFVTVSELLGMQQPYMLSGGGGHNETN
jgi:peptidoglycan/xylan/chitin deacetylase (PgdA/CDA1 family)